MFERDRPKLIEALNSIEQHGNLDALPCTAYQKLALTKVAYRRGLVRWRGPVAGCALTRKGKRFLRKDSPSRSLARILATRAAIAGAALMLVFGVAQTSFVEAVRSVYLPAAATTSTPAGGPISVENAVHAIAQSDTADVRPPPTAPLPAKSGLRERGDPGQTPRPPAKQRKAAKKHHHDHGFAKDSARQNAWSSGGGPLFGASPYGSTESVRP